MFVENNKSTWLGYISRTGGAVSRLNSGPIPDFHARRPAMNRALESDIIKLRRTLLESLAFGGVEGSMEFVANCTESELLL